MEKIKIELDKFLIVISISTFILFLIVLFKNHIYVYLEMDKGYFSSILAFVTIFFLFFVYFKIQKTSKEFQEEFNRIVLEKNKKLKLINTELVTTNESLKKQLYIDTLTKLPNRKALEEDIRDMEKPKLIILDIDSFREINEYYGIGIGDIVLCRVSDLLISFCENSNLRLYRVGSDEFALLENSDLDMDRYEELANDLIKLFKTDKINLIELGDILEINITLGFSFDEVNTIEKAFIALGEAKIKQINFLCYFENIGEKTDYKEQTRWTKFIEKAIQDNRVIPYYQPIFNAKKELLKHETLVRIEDENEGTIPPGMFLDIAKKTKKYRKIEKMIIQKSFEKIQGTDEIISVNLLARDMSDGNVSNFVVSMLNKYGVAKQVIFEILEDENIENLPRVDNFLKRIKKMGCKIAIYDFGTGYSNFSYLIKMHPDYIKIDGTLIKNLVTDTNAHAIVVSIVAFAKALGVKTIAEFIHSEEIFEICKDLGVDEFQGFYLGEPSMKLCSHYR